MLCCTHMQRKLPPKSTAIGTSCEAREEGGWDHVDFGGNCVENVLIFKKCDPLFSRNGFPKQLVQLSSGAFFGRFIKNECLKVILQATHRWYWVNSISLKKFSQYLFLQELIQYDCKFLSEVIKSRRKLLADS